MKVYNYKARNFLIGKTVSYQISIKDQIFIYDDLTESNNTSFSIKLTMMEIDTAGNGIMSLDFSDIKLDFLPSKVNDFLNKFINLKNSIIFKLNRVGEVLDVDSKEFLTNKELINLIYEDNFFKSLKNEEQVILKNHMEKFSFLEHKTPIINNNLLKFLFPGFSRNFGENKFALVTEELKIQSNFLENHAFDVQFSMNINDNFISNELLNFIHTGDIFIGTEQEELLLNQKIKNYFSEKDINSYNDYNFIVMGDYKVNINSFFIENATINISETLNEESIEFNKEIEIELIENFQSSLLNDDTQTSFISNFLKRKREF